ncbi:MAG: 3-deoxy-7-phosphoheptulonate synthase [Legionellales bacterium]|nr:3-deoxy-7-phosphoheptulonate synthase [Legionellales bacterium]
MSSWQLNSWLTKPNFQDIPYNCKESLLPFIASLKNKSDIVKILDIQKLHLLIEKAAEKKCIILQGGDCAERFNSSLDHSINTVNLLNNLANIIQSELKKPVINIGRIAGQFSKPRTNLYDNKSNTLYSYRGDLINHSKPHILSRTPDPSLLIKGYYKSKNIYKLLETLPTKYIESLDLEIPTIFTSHEAHNLYYEQALTRLSEENLYYNTSTHFPWVGVRTNKIDSAHIEYIKGINNPVAIKINSEISVDEIIKIINYVNPKNYAGRISLITRFGHTKVQKYLPILIQGISKNKKNVTWLCDPMHGNTIRNSEGIKTRLIEDINKEIMESINIHRNHHTNLSGLHLELTSAKIRECQTRPNEKFTPSLVDPRLNAEQSIEIINTFCKGMQND